MILEMYLVAISTFVCLTLFCCMVNTIRECLK